MIISSLNTIPNVRNNKIYNKNNKNNKSNSIKNQKQGSKDFLNVYPRPYIPTFGDSKLSKRDEEIKTIAKDSGISLEDARKYYDEVPAGVSNYIDKWMPFEYRFKEPLKYLINDEELTVDRLERIKKIGKKTKLKPLVAMSIEKLEHNLKKNIQRLADELSISVEEAKIYNDFYLSFASINPTQDGNEIGLNAIKGYGREKFDLAVNFIMPIVAQEREIEFKNRSPLQYHSPYNIYDNKLVNSAYRISEKKAWKPLGWAIPDMNVPRWQISSSRLRYVPYNKEERNWPIPAQNTILFGPEGTGKTYVADKVCEHLEHFGVKVESIKFSPYNPEENCKKIRETFINGYERYKETGKYTVIKFEDDLEDYPTELQEISGICDVISEMEKDDVSYNEIGVFSIGTTKNLKDVNEFGLSNYSIPIGVMKDFNVGEMLKFSLLKYGEKESAQELDCKKIEKMVKEDLLSLTPHELELIVKKAKRQKKFTEQRITADSILEKMREYEQSGREAYTADVRKEFRRDRQLSKGNNKNCKTYPDKIIENSTVEEDINKIVECIANGKREYGKQLFDFLNNAKYDYSSYINEENGINTLYHLFY